MFIKRIELKNFKRFRFSEIKEFTADFRTPVTIITARNGSGKALRHKTPIRTPDGWVPVEQVQTGDTILAWDGTSTTVIGVFPQGKKEIHRVYFSDGRSLDTCSEHLWSITTDRTTGKTSDVVSTKQLSLELALGSKVYIPKSFDDNGDWLEVVYVEHMNFEDYCTCLQVDHTDKLFIAGENIVTHNSSLLTELSPLPTVRSNYDALGYKRMLIDHEGHQYELITNFANRISPHSFILDGQNLNPSGATVIQEDLVAQHFGITTAIRNLIYSKVSICKTTKAERKQMFLNINPLQLGLILETHKKAVSKVKDARATLNHLYSRKADIEGKLLPADTLVQHKMTKEKMSNEILAIDKMCYAIEQHIANLKNTFAQDLEYRSSCADKNQPLVAVKSILQTCKDLTIRSIDFTQVSRGESFDTDFANYRQKRAEVQQKQSDLSQRIQDLSAEINEYQKHMEASTDRPPAKVEQELAEVDKELSKYPPLVHRPIPSEELNRYSQGLTEKIQPLLMFFRDLEKPMVAPKLILSIRVKVSNLQNQLNQLDWQLGQSTTSKENINNELLQLTEKSEIPKDCSFNTCGLKNIITAKKQKLEEDLKVILTQEATATKAKTKVVKLLDILKNKIAPYESVHAVDQYNLLLSMLSYGYFNIENWGETLLDQVRTQPLLIYNKLEELITSSKDAQKIRELEQQKTRLKTELDVLLKSNATSTGFLQKKLQEKELQVQSYLKDLSAVDIELADLEKTCALYLEYSLATQKIQELQETYSKGERALLVSKAITYWQYLLNHLLEGKKLISEDLRQLESLVKEQDVLRATYNNEIITHIGKVEKDRLDYERIEMALSPTTGMPYKSMIRYLNALIGNVNYFLSQMWSYKMRVIPLKEDDPLDYAFRIEVGNETNGDISMLSDGQTAAVNLSWILTILLQLRLLDKIPLFGDELGRELDQNHKIKMLNFLSSLVDNKLITQLFLVNHAAIFTEGFRDSSIICLSPDDMADSGISFNEHVSIVRA